VWAVGEIGAGRGGGVEVASLDGSREFGIVGQLDQGLGVGAEDEPHRTEEVGVLGGVGESLGDRLAGGVSAGRIPQHVDRVVCLVGVLGGFLADQHLHCAPQPAQAHRFGPDLHVFGDAEREFLSAAGRTRGAVEQQLVSGPAEYRQGLPGRFGGFDDVAQQPSRTARAVVDEIGRIEEGEWVVDLRERTAFAAGHLGGTLGFELSDSFVTYLGWLYRWGAPLTLIGENENQVTDARRELVRIGIDDLTGAAVGEIRTLVAGTELRSHRVADFPGLAKALREKDITVLDVRQRNEHAESHIDGAINIPLHELLGRMGEIPTGEVWVHCASGYRASVAASMIDRPERTTLLINDDYDNAKDTDIIRP